MPDPNDRDEYEDAEESTGPLHGLVIGPPFAIATECGLLTRDDAAKIPGCCACVSCDNCGQSFRVDLLSDKGLHACPKCQLEYTSVLIVAVADDYTILQQALDTVLVSNGIRVPNPDGDDDQGDGDEGDDDDQLGEPDAPDDDATEQDLDQGDDREAEPNR